ncbi:MAG: endonuclease/exonuclease/phosphatase family protein [Pseudonocardia sp.]
MSAAVRTDRAPARPGPGWRRAVLVAIAVPVLLGAALALWAPAVGLDQRLPFAQLTAFRVQLTGTGLLVAALLLLVPRRAVRLLGAALLVVAVSPLPQIAPRVVAEASASAPGLTVVTLNVFLDRLDPATVAELAVRRGADVVALPEATERYAADVVRHAAAHGMEYRAATAGPVPPPTRGGDREGPYPTSLLVRSELRPTFRAGVPDLPQGAVTAHLSGALPVAVSAVHPLAPVPGQEPNWAADHAELARLCATGAPVVLAGDFNSTLDHSPMREVLAAGCRDAAEVAGAGLAGTWPAGAAAALRVPIDHVLLTPAAGVVVSYEVVDVAGTDHRGLVVTISPPV